MPDNPTEKKLTFLEWVAYYKICFGEVNKNDLVETGRELQFMADRFHGDCNRMRGKDHLCTLCQLEKWLSEYHKYFKQNSK